MFSATGFCENRTNADCAQAVDASVCVCPRVLETTPPPEPIEPRLLRPTHRQVRARGLQTGAEPGRGGYLRLRSGDAAGGQRKRGLPEHPPTPRRLPGTPRGPAAEPRGGGGRRGGSRDRLPSRLAAVALPSLPARRAEVTSYRRGAARGGCRRPPGILRRGRGVSGPAGAPRPDCAEGAGPGPGRAAPAEGRVTPGRKWPTWPPRTPTCRVWRGRSACRAPRSRGRENLVTELSRFGCCPSRPLRGSLGL